MRCKCVNVSVCERVCVQVNVCICEDECMGQCEYMCVHMSEKDSV